MKTYATLLLAGACLALTACGKDDDTTQPPADTTPRLTATVDGTTWTSATTGHALSSGLLQFNGRNAAGDIIELFMEEATGPVTITSSDPDTYILGRYESASGAEWKTNLPGGSATITVTEFNQTTKRGSGTFSFTAPAFSGGASGEKMVTNGTFSNIKLAM